MKLLMFFLAAMAAFGQTYDARHDHWRRSCTGQLTFDTQGVAFESSTKPKHSWKVSYLDAQQMKVLDNGEFRLLTYKDRKWRLGADREYRLRVADKQFAAQVGPLLENRLERRFVSGYAAGEGKILWELPAKHRLRFSGTEGVLVVAADRILYRTEKPGDSRTWFFPDIAGISSSDPYQFSITTYERALAHYGDRKGFNFQLKQPLSEDRYNDLWLRLEQSKGLQLLTERTP